MSFDRTPTPGAMDHGDERHELSFACTRAQLPEEGSEDDAGLWGAASDAVVYPFRAAGVSSENMSK